MGLKKIVIIIDFTCGTTLHNCAVLKEIILLTF